MDAKQAVAIFAVVILAAAGIGAAYAFNAAVDNENNSASIQYWKLLVTDSSAKDAHDTSGEDVPSEFFSKAFSAETPYDTVTYWNATDEKQDIKLTLTAVAKPLGVVLSPLGFLQVKAETDTEQPAPDLTGDNHYLISVSMVSLDTATNGSVNDKYDYFAGEVTLGNGTTAPEHTIATHPTTLVMLEKGVADAQGYVKYEAKVPVQKIGTGVAIALYAVPKALDTIDSIKGTYLKEDGTTTFKTDVLQDAKVTLSASSVVYTTSAYQANSATKLAPAVYKYTYDPMVTDWDLGSVLVVGTYKDTGSESYGGVTKDYTETTKRIMQVSTETPYADNVTEITLKVAGTGDPGETLPMTAQESDPATP